MEQTMTAIDVMNAFWFFVALGVIDLVALGIIKIIERGKDKDERN